MDMDRRKALSAVVGATALSGASAIAASAPSASASALSPEQAHAIGKEAFLWGMHPVAIYHLRFDIAQNPASPRYVGINRVFWYRTKMKAMPRSATSPNATTLYGWAMLDLTTGPVIVTVPGIADRYWSVQLYDNYGRWWHLVGNQFNAPGPVRRLLIGPDVRGGLPDGFAGAEIAQSPSRFVGLAVRIALTSDDPAELAQVNAIQDRITVMSFQDWVAAGRREVKTEAMPTTPGRYPAYPGMESVTEPGQLKGLDFLRWVGLVLNDDSFTKQPDSHQEVEAFRRLARLGLARGVTFDPSSLPPAIAQAAAAGVEEARAECLALFARGIGIERNGWGFLTGLGYRDTDWRQRALYGLVAILAPVPVQSHLGAFALKDSKGRQLSGEHRYTITFRLDDMPPVTEFWEIPLYDDAGYFYDNPLDRYTINSFMLERGELATADGRLVIYVQHDEPTDPAQRRNWLPAPASAFQFAARFYGPKSSAISGTYDMPGIVRVE